jgi:hypothetical protein
MRPKNAKAPATLRQQPEKPAKVKLRPRISALAHKRGKHDHNEMALLARRQRVADAYLRGLSQAKIAQAENVNQGQISRDLAFIREAWLASAVMAMDARKAQELAKIDRLEAIAWQAWEQSCKSAEIYHTGVDKGRVNKEGKPLPERQKSWKTIKGQFGDARFLERVAWCINKRCELLGLDAPKKLAPTNPDGTEPFAGHLSDAQFSAGLRELCQEFTRSQGEIGALDSVAQPEPAAVEPIAGPTGDSVQTPG